MSAENTYYQEYATALMQDVMSQYLLRKGLVEQYAFAVPNSEALDLITGYSPIVEMGAGSGYWAYLLRERGATVECFDNNTRPFEKRWMEVKQGTPSILSEYPNHALFLCWPPYNEDMAISCLKFYKGSTVIYIGEGPSGCCATRDFFKILKRLYTKHQELGIPTWPYIHDQLEIWKQKDENRTL